MSPPGPFRFRAGRWFAPLLAGLAGCGAPRAAVEELWLPATGDTVLTPYGDVTGAAWLEGRRWVVIAPQDRAVTVADFEKEAAAPFGATGRRAFDQPFHLFRAGDSILVADWARRQLTAWSLRGVQGATLPASDRLRGALPRGRDAAGNWYYEVRSPPGALGEGNRDSAAVVRMAADGSGLDTVARLAPFELAEVLSDGRRRLERRLLSGQDRWGVNPEGEVWVARVGPNRVDWHRVGGRPRTGKPLPDQVLPVTENDREIFLRRFDPGLRATVEQIPFAAIKPPFEAAFEAPDGGVWLVKSRAIGDTLRRYQVVNARGHLTARYAHRGLGRILAVSDSLALVGEPYAEGTRLLLFRIPVPAAGDPTPPS